MNTKNVGRAYFDHLVFVGVKHENGFQEVSTVHAIRNCAASGTSAGTPPIHSLHAPNAQLSRARFRATILAKKIKNLMKGTKR